MPLKSHLPLWVNILSYQISFLPTQVCIPMTCELVMPSWSYTYSSALFSLCDSLGWSFVITKLLFSLNDWNSCRELPKIEAAESLTMATVWQHKNYHLVQDDAPQAPKLAHCPTLMNAQAELCNPSTGHTVENSPSFYNNWGSLDSKDMKWQQLRSSAQHHDYHSESFDFNEVLGSHFKSAGLQALAVECSNAKDGSAGQCFMSSIFLTSS
jgi:hypothetical protein